MQKKKNVKQVFIREGSYMSVFFLFWTQGILLSIQCSLFHDNLLCPPATSIANYTQEAAILIL